MSEVKTFSLQGGHLAEDGQVPSWVMVETRKWLVGRAQTHTTDSEAGRLSVENPKPGGSRAEGATSRPA